MANINSELPEPLTEDPEQIGSIQAGATIKPNPRKRKIECMDRNQTFVHEDLKKLKKTVEEKEPGIESLEKRCHQPEVPRSYLLIEHWAEQLYNDLPLMGEKLNTTENVLFILNSIIVSPNRLQYEGFPKTNISLPKTIDVIFTDSMKKVFDELAVSSVSDPEVCLRGPKGVGKSFLLLLLMFKLRSNPKNRVIYVNNPVAIRNGISICMANEFIYAFYQDRKDKNFPLLDRTKGQNDGSALEQWYNYVCTKDYEVTFKHFLENARTYCYDNDLSLIIILDQYNEYYRAQANKKVYADIFIRDFAPTSCDHFIYSVSDNNEEFQMNASATNITLTTILTDQDVAWLLYLKGFLGIEVDNSQATPKLKWDNNQTVEEILTATGKNPYEVSSILKIFKKLNPQSEVNVEDDISEQSKIFTSVENVINIEKEKTHFKEIGTDFIDAYFEERVHYYKDIHMNYYTLLSQEKKENFFKIAASLDTGVKMPLTRVYDKNLIYRIEDDNQSAVYHPVCPAAHKALELHLSENTRFQEWNSKTDSRIFYSDILNAIAGGSGLFHNTMRGYALEKLLIDGLAVKRGGNFTIHYYKNKNTKESLTLTVNKVDYFKKYQLLRKMKQCLNFLKGVLSCFICPILIYLSAH